MILGAEISDDIARQVYCVFGLPIDALEMPPILDRVKAAADSRERFLISTPNLNFLVSSRSDPEFRESLLDSDLCPADGMPIVWIARVIGVPIKRRVSGSDIFDALKPVVRGRRRLKIFLFGGAEGAAAAAAKTINETKSGLYCVGTLNPGFITVDEMSSDQIISDVNVSEADFLVASLGARKGQLWLHRNHERLDIPVRAHLGAVVNFQAGTVRRAPAWLATSGLEWLWRIKEEPQLWRRYAYDGAVLLCLSITRVVPLAILNRLQKLRSEMQPEALQIGVEQAGDVVIIRFAGDANQRNIGSAIATLRETLTRGNKEVVIDLAMARVIDSRFLGFLLMARKQLKQKGAKLTVVTSSTIRKLFRLNGVEFLLSNPSGRA